MGLQGADVEQLRELSALMRNRADAIEHDVTSAVTAILRRSPWGGSDADGFRSTWMHHSVPHLRAVVSALREAADALARNACEQDTASASSSGVEEMATVAPKSGGDSEPRKGLLGAHRDYLDLAFAEYSRAPGHKDAIPAGWEEVSSAQLGELGIDPKLFGVAGDDFNATLFRSVDGRYVLSFEGTDPKDGRDWATDAAGVVACPPQIKKAVKAAVQVRTCLEEVGVNGDSLIYTGHSLGGEQAAAASIATGSEAVTFNAAGLSAVSYACASTEP